MKINDQVLKTLMENLNFTSDPSKLIVTIDDLKYIPSLSKIISFEKIIQQKTITLDQIPHDKLPDLMFEFLKKYNFVQKFTKYYYFDYNKMLEFWPNLEYYQEIFKKLEPDLTITIDNEEHKLYRWDRLEDNDKIYIGYMFFSAFNKIREKESPNTKEYLFFTDIYLDALNLGMIENFEEFFLKEFVTFINTNFGSVFGDYSFGSNLKNYVQSKELTTIFDRIKLDIIGFISDLSLLYNNALEFKDLVIEKVDDYSYKIIVLVKINEKVIQVQIVKNY